jgi:hypothetical protein
LNWLLLEFNNGYNEVLLGYELGQVVEQWKNQHFEDHLCPRPQDADMDMVGKKQVCPIYTCPCSSSWLTASQWGQLGGVKWLLCLDQLCVWTTSWLQGTRPSSVWSHPLCWSFYSLVSFGLLPWQGSPCILMPCPTQRYHWSQSGALWYCALPQQISLVDQNTCVSYALCNWPLYISESDWHILSCSHKECHICQVLSDSRSLTVLSIRLFFFFGMWTICWFC